VSGDDSFQVGAGKRAQGNDRNTEFMATTTTSPGPPWLGCFGAGRSQAGEKHPQRVLACHDIGMPSTDHGTIVVVEDDANIADLLDMSLRQAGYRVIQAGNGEAGIAAVDRERPRLVILDVGLPGDMDGLDVCMKIRTKSSVPILFLTARDGEVDRILGLELGADDYVTKPFSPRELVARVKAILRRLDHTEKKDARPETIDLGTIAVDIARREVMSGGVAVNLATREFDLLAYFASNQGLVLSRQQLLDGVWGAGWFGDERTVDVHVRQLRKKLGDDFALKTVFGVGYRLN
jgi:DNA-binding response OmpR family regulator